MELNEYQEKAQSFDLTKGTDKHASHAAFQLIEEVGELAGVFKRWLRGDGELNREKLLDESGDALWGLAATAAAHGFTLEEVAQHNIKKLEDRRARGVIKGSGNR